MRIELNNVIPGPFREFAELDSEIWGTQVVFDRPGFYQVWPPSADVVLHILTEPRAIRLSGIVVREPRPG